MLTGSGLVNRQRLTRMALRYSLVIILLIFIISLGVLNDYFLTFSNFNVILLQVSTNALLATGATFVILTAGIDLSVGSLVGMSGVVAALIAQHAGAGWATLAIVAGTLTGLAMGALNGFLVAWAKVPGFVATLGTMTIGLGCAYVLSQGQPVSGLSNQFLSLGNDIAGIPIPVLVMLAVLVVSFVVLTRTYFGMHVYAVGGNPVAASVAGIKVKNILFAVYAISGMLAGLAGVILASRVTAGIPTTGSGYELDAIAAAVIGGVSLMGGRGSLWGTIFGFMLIGILDNGLNIMNVSPFYQLIIKGLIIIGAVFIDSYVNRKEA